MGSNGNGGRRELASRPELEIYIEVLREALGEVVAHERRQRSWHQEQLCGWIYSQYRGPSTDDALGSRRHWNGSFCPAGWNHHCTEARSICASRRAPLRCSGRSSAPLRGPRAINTG
jgi:hypothetical protein